MREIISWLLGALFLAGTLFGFAGFVTVATLAFLGALIFGVWLLLEYLKISRKERFTGVYDIDIKMLESRDNVTATVAYRGPTNSWDISFIGVDDEHDIWDELSDTEKVLVNVEINLYFDRMRG